MVARAIRARAADAVHLLGSVDQQEEERESARRHRTQLERESLYLVQQLVEGGRIGFTVATGTTGAAEALDRVERLLALEVADHAAE